MENAIRNVMRILAFRTKATEAAANDATRPWYTRIGILFWLAIIWVFFISFSALLANYLPLPSALDTNLRGVYLPPLVDGHLLGTDGVGRDMLARAIHGARVSLSIAYTSPFIALFFGLALGISAGYFRGRVDSAISIFIDSILAFPNIVAVMAFLFFFGSNMLNMILVLGFFAIPGDTRVARANTILFSQREFVLAARAQGASHLRIMVRELLPNVIIPLISLVLFGMSIVIVIEGALAFLGVGIQPPTPTWGRMISDGFEEIGSSPHVTFIPATFMFFTILSFNIIGDRLRALNDVKGSQA